LFEDERLLVVNKPSGLAVHGGSGISLGLIEAFRSMRPEQPYLELVHRLDRATSGCIILAKKRSALRELHRQIRENQVSKQYLTLLKGHWDHRARVNLPLDIEHRKEFKHPKTGEELAISAPLPDELSKVIDKMKA